MSVTSPAFPCPSANEVCFSKWPKSLSWSYHRLSTVPVILAHAQNGEPLTREHGFPLRVILPGYIGARSVKWLDSISIELRETDNFYQSKYTLCAPCLPDNYADYPQ